MMELAMVLAHAPGSGGTHEEHREKREYLRIESEDNEAMQWASLVFFVVFVCVLCSCVPMTWPYAPVASVPVAHGGAWMTEEHRRRERRSMAEQQAMAERQAMELAALLGHAAQSAQAAQAARAGDAAGRLGQAAALAAAALPENVQLKDKANDDDVFVLRACMCGRDGHVTLRLDSHYTVDGTGKMVRGNSMVQWPYKLLALTFHLSERKLEIKSENYPPVPAELNDEDARLALKGLPALAKATGVEWNEVE
jgi:hypothetical protein